MSVYDNLVGMEEVLDEFAIETTELLEGVNEDLVNLESGGDDDLVNRVFRAFHTIKGTCGFLGFIQAKECGPRGRRSTQSAPKRRDPAPRRDDRRAAGEQ
jgi:hypothetical protein